jgi:sugar lactone lactonase YvrE
MALRWLLLCVVGLWLASLAACDTADRADRPDQPGMSSCLDDVGVLCTIAGTGTSGFAGDGGDPLDATMSFPLDVALAPDGALHIADWNNNRVRRIDPDSDLIDTIAGAGELCAQENSLGLPARELCLNHPSDLDFTPAGEIFIAGWFDSRIYSVHLHAGGEPGVVTGVVTGVIGTGARGYDGDGGPATGATFDTVASTAPDPAGGLYVMDQQNQTIRHVAADGTIEPHAGRCVVEWDDSGAAPCAPDEEPVACPDSEKLTCGDPATTCLYPCTPDLAGDGGPASDLRMAQPFGAQAVPSGRLALAPDGTLYFSDPLNHRVRAIDPEGIARTVAEGPDEPADLVLAPDGDLLVAYPYANCITRTSPGGEVHPVAGACGSDPDLAADGTLATSAQLYDPFGLALSGDVLYFTDTGNHLVRAVRLE